MYIRCIKNYEKENNISWLRSLLLSTIELYEERMKKLKCCWRKRGGVFSHVKKTSVSERKATVLTYTPQKQES